MVNRQVKFELFMSNANNGLNLLSGRSRERDWAVAIAEG
jgi:hypothetical protein